MSLELPYSKFPIEIQFNICYKTLFLLLLEDKVLTSFKLNGVTMNSTEMIFILLIITVKIVLVR